MARTGASLSNAHGMTSPSPEALRGRLLRALAESSEAMTTADLRRCLSAVLGQDVVHERIYRWRSSRSAVKSPGPHQAAATHCGGDDAAWFEGLPPLPQHANQRPNTRPASSTSAASCRATAEAPTATA